MRQAFPDLRSLHACAAAATAALAACASRGHAPEPSAAALASPSWRFLRERYDANGDGRIAPAEYSRSPQGFTRLDADGDGFVTALDFEAEWDGKPRVADFQWGEGGPEVGDPAPPFTLRSTDGATIALDSFRGKKPVALVFGSFT